MHFQGLLGGHLCLGQVVVERHKIPFDEPCVDSGQTQICQTKSRVFGDCPLKKFSSVQQSFVAPLQHLGTTIDIQVVCRQTNGTRFLVHHRDLTSQSVHDSTRDHMLRDNNILGPTIVDVRPQMVTAIHSDKEVARFSVES